MWRVEEFFTGKFSNDGEFDPSWFRHRFRGTIMCDPRDNGCFVLDEVEHERGDWRFYAHLYDYDEGEITALSSSTVRGFLVGVPEHGYITSGTNVHWLPRRAYDKWKWGWVPDLDTQHTNWRSLLEPKHRGWDAVLDDSGGNEFSFSINSSYAFHCGEVLNNGTLVGNIINGVFIINQECDHLLHDTSITIPRRLAA